MTDDTLAESLPYTKLGGATFHVCATGREYTLPPVLLAIQGSPFYFQDHLTPDEADLLADALRDMAALTRAAS